MIDLRLLTIAVTALTTMSEAGMDHQEHNPYPDIDADVQFQNYADYTQQYGGGGYQEQVIYDYVDHGYDDYRDDNRYRVDEKAPNQYDYSSRDYQIVEEGTTGTYEESEGWSYDPQYRGSHHHAHQYRDSYGDHRDSYGSYGRDSYGGNRGGYREEHHHHHHYGGDGGRYQQNNYREQDRYQQNGYRDDRDRGGYRQQENRDLLGGGTELVWLFVVPVVIGVAVCVFMQIQEQKRQGRVQENAAWLKELPDAPKGPVNGSDPVIFQGKCFVDGAVSDPMFGIRTQGHPALYRDVEVFCWIQKAQDTKKRIGDQVIRSKKYTYTAKWVSDFVDSRSFKDKNYNQNIRPDVQTELFMKSNVRVGDFYSVDIHDLSSAFGTVLATKELIQGTPAMAEFSRNGIWSIDSKNNCLVRQRNPGKDTVGDVRIKYRVIEQFQNIGRSDIWATVCGIPNGERISQWDRVKNSIMAGKVPKARFVEQQTK